MWLVPTETHRTVITGDAHKHNLTDYVAEFARRVGAIAVGWRRRGWWSYRLMSMAST